MNNIGLIIAREYLSRVRKKSFIIMTILAPVLFGGFFFIIGWSATKGIDNKTIQVVDDSGLFGEVFIDDAETTFAYSSMTLEEGKEEVMKGDFDGLLYIPSLDVDNPQGVVFYAHNNPSITLMQSLSHKIENEIENIKLRKSGIDKEVLDNLKADVDIHTFSLDGSGDEKESSSIAATVVGYIASFMIYIFIFVYGAMCMRGVIEEKSTRIIEVIIASVKPFQLMMGKVIGIAGVGLSQFILWIILTIGISSIGGGIVGSQMMDTRKDQMENLEKMGVPQDATQQAVQQEVEDHFFTQLTSALDSVNIPMVVIAFLFFFLSGYLLYGALFAAIGSAVDSDADAQQFMFPVTMPLIAAIVLLSAVLNDPNGSLAFWLSMIPFTSPVIMMMRVPFGVEWWELALSMSLMIAGFIFTIWVASRIYRIGILMHGTKVNYKVLAKWFMMRN